MQTIQFFLNYRKKRLVLLNEEYCQNKLYICYSKPLEPEMALQSNYAHCIKRSQYILNICMWCFPKKNGIFYYRHCLF